MFMIASATDRMVSVTDITLSVATGNVSANVNARGKRSVRIVFVIVIGSVFI